jgi:hypothetical protein
MEELKFEILEKLNNKEINQLIYQLRKTIINDIYFLYVIRNKKTNQYYIGSSIDAEKRFKNHLHP